MPRQQRVFYGFPGSPAALEETITNAVSIVRKEPTFTRNHLRFTLWPDMAVSGTRLINTILQNIDRGDVFACDLTYLNANVSFELGYAIGRFKRVWISLNSSITDSERQFRRVFYGLTGYGYAQYTNAQQLAKEFLVQNPLSSLDATLLGETHRRPMPRQEDPTVLYVKPPIDTDAVIAASLELESSPFQHNIILDDPNENPSPTLDWYATKIGEADAVLCHLLAENQMGYLEHNAKCALIAGIARGLNKSLRILAHEPFEAPVDYQGLVTTHATAEACKLTVQSWIQELPETITTRRRRRPATPSRSGELDLRGLRIGEPVAENERRSIDNYFIETSAYFRAMDSPVSIVVGRRGSGKSAQLYAMEAALSQDTRNHVCVIKPVGYETAGMVDVLRSILGQSERGYLIESLWKFLIYSELGRSVYSQLMSRPPYHDQTDAEVKFMDYYKNNKDLFDRPFSERLDIAVRSLRTMDAEADSIEAKERISELLHANQLVTLRDSLGGALSDHETVGILIDNLDGPWGVNTDIEHLSELLWGLLQVGDDIVADFQVEDYWRKAVSINLTIFLRSDIFAFIQPTAAEQDKLPIQRIIWDDASLLRKLVDARLEFGTDTSDDASQIWERFFPNEVVGIPAWDFITNTVLPRPRDIVYLIREAIDGAINRGHPSVTPQDLLSARDQYSEYVLRSILAEDDPRKSKLEAILFEFAGALQEVTIGDIQKRFANAGVKVEDYNFYVDLLCDVSFLAIGTPQGYRYSKHESDRQVVRRTAQHIARNNGIEESFKVSKAFWQVLGIED